MQEAGPSPGAQGVNPPHTRPQNPAARLRPLRGATKTAGAVI
jgi:hypothetical protein